MFKILFCFFMGVGPVVVAQCVPLDLETAWQKLITYSPTLAAAEAEIEVRLAEKKQVSLLPNPIAIVEAENLSVVHPNDDVEPPVTTFAVEQLIELGGKRYARKQFASTVADIAFWDAQIERQNLRLALTVSFIEVSVAQEMLALAQERAILADKMLEAVEIQMAAGKCACIEQKHAIIDQMKAQILLREAVANLNLAKKKLSSMWGCPIPDFDCVLFELFNCIAPPSCACALNEIFQSPDFAKAEATIFSANQNIKLQEANGIPDVTLTVGYSIFDDSDQNGWVIGAQIPLPLFDRNQGNIKKALLEKDQAQFQMDEVKRTLQMQIMALQERVLVAFENSEAIKNIALSEAQEAFDLILTGYNNGKIDYLKMLNAHGELFEVQEKYIEILYDYHISRAELERLTGHYT